MEPLIDMHCHLLPGVDDGPEKMEESLELLRREAEQGVRKILLTPHHRAEYFETSRDRVREAFSELKQRTLQEQIPIELYLGCEFHRESSILELLSQDPAYRINGGNYVLLEFSEADSFSTIRQYTTGVIRSGFHPVIAHVERYPYAAEIDKIRQLIEEGALIQVNAGSILGTEGWRSRFFSRKLLKYDLVHLIGSDAHDITYRTPNLGECAAYIYKKYGNDKVCQLLWEHPLCLLENNLVNF